MYHLNVLVPTRTGTSSGPSLQVVCFRSETCYPAAVYLAVRDTPISFPSCSQLQEIPGFVHANGQDGQDRTSSTTHWQLRLMTELITPGVGDQIPAQRLWDKVRQDQRTFPTADLVTLAFIMATLVHALRHPSAEFLLLGCTTCPWHSPSHWHLFTGEEFCTFTHAHSISPCGHQCSGKPPWETPYTWRFKSENLLCPWANCPLPMSRTGFKSPPRWLLSTTIPIFKNKSRQSLKSPCKDFFNSSLYFWGLVWSHHKNTQLGWKNQSHKRRKNLRNHVLLNALLAIYLISYPHVVDEYYPARSFLLVHIPIPLVRSNFADWLYHFICPILLICCIWLYHVKKSCPPGWLKSLVPCSSRPKKTRNGRHFGMWITTHLNHQTYTYNLVIWYSHP